MSDFIPNSFQHPNAYVDRFMHLLTGEEHKVLTYMARRIFGWSKDSDRISMSQFQHGQVGRDGTRHDHGTGLSYTAIDKALDALQKFRLARQVAPPDSKNSIAAEWTLETNSAKVDEIGLIARSKQSEEQAKIRTQKARSVVSERRQSGTPLSATEGVELAATPLSATEHPPSVPLSTPPSVPLTHKTQSLNPRLNPGECAPRDARPREATKLPIDSQPPTAFDARNETKAENTQSREKPAPLIDCNNPQHPAFQTPAYFATVRACRIDLDLISDRMRVRCATASRKLEKKYTPAEIEAIGAGCPFERAASPEQLCDNAESWLHPKTNEVKNGTNRTNGAGSGQPYSTAAERTTAAWERAAQRLVAGADEINAIRARRAAAGLPPR